MEKNKTCNRPWRYSLAMFGLSIAGYMYVTYGTFFYTETIGLSMKLIALGNVLYAVWDAFNDPSRVICRTAHAPAGDGANPGCW